MRYAVSDLGDTRAEIEAIHEQRSRRYTSRDPRQYTVSDRGDTRAEIEAIHEQRSEAIHSQRLRQYTSRDPRRYTVRDRGDTYNNIIYTDSAIHKLAGWSHR